MSAIDPPEKKKRGCFFYGCISLLVCVFVVAVAGFFIVRYIVNTANGVITQYTETQPMVFPKVEMPAAELQKLKQQVDAFNGAMEAHSNTPPLVLTSRDINALLNSGTNLNNLKDVVYVDIEGDKIKGEVSLPLEKMFRFPLVHTKGRYLNGVGTFKVMVTNDALGVYVVSLEVKGKPLPPQFMMQLKGKNMAEDFENNATNNPATNRFESIELKDGKMTIKAKAN